MLRREKEFVVALVVVVIVFVVLALPYAVTEAYGLKAMKLILLMQLVVLAVFSLLIWWQVRYRQASHDLEILQVEIEKNRRTREKPRTRCMREVNQKERDK